MKKFLTFPLILLAILLFACAYTNGAPQDGRYTIEVALAGGSGRASITSPAEVTLANGKMTAKIIWSSPNYDLMLVDGAKYFPVNAEGNSTFELPIATLDQDIVVSAETTAMSQPHMIDYTLCFNSATLKSAGEDQMGWIIVAIAGGMGMVVAIRILSKRQKRRREVEHGA